MILSCMFQFQLLPFASILILEDPLDLILIVGTVVLYIPLLMARKSF